MADPWWVVIVAGLPSAASGVWVIWRWWVDRADRHDETVLTREARMAQELDAQRAVLSRDQADLFDRMRDDLLRLRTRLGEAEHDRDRGWDLARYWHRRCHELRYAGLNAQALVAGLCAREDVAVPTWPDMAVGGLEDPVNE